MFHDESGAQLPSCTDERRSSFSVAKPFFPTDARPVKDAAKKVNADVGLVRIRQSNLDSTSDHELMPATRQRSLKAQLTQSLN